MIGPEVQDDQDTWHNAGDVAQQAIADVANKAKDRADEEIDVKRVHNGMTLDEYLSQK